MAAGHGIPVQLRFAEGGTRTATAVAQVLTLHLRRYGVRVTVDDQLPALPDTDMREY